ncbi:MAG TPA: secretin N-terminal domain-containing protein [Spirochaetota bacterium]|nr:secretin N-terminal domain-containing protein [Spirochaetota bacterium]HPJ40793.1 secretin N-terminal domain-containing protein [Spirochaetota bacterium]HPR36062.1 secretin N-terminal domain-containing protein [Spirochaetota bacterium]HRX45976.1 secretin N-terminal domain-containing protein [Spirochaetota bacterium]
MIIKKTAILLTISFILLSSLMVDNVNGQVSKKHKEKSFSLNFNDVEISEFLNVMSQLLGKNIILSDKVKGKISISSAKKVPLEEAFDLMKSILEIKGFAVIETANLIKIVPVKDAVQKNIEVIVDGDKVKLEDENAVTYLLEINYADANELAAVLKTLKSPDADIVVYRTLNMLILSGHGSEINGLIKVARSLDKKPAGTDSGDTFVDEGATIHVVHLENADATGLAEVLSRIPFSQYAVVNTQPIQKQTADPKGKVTSGTTQAGQQPKLSIIPNKETNSLIINASGAEFREINKIIKQLDMVRPQVLIEAIVVEVDASSNWGLGINWDMGGQKGTNLFGGSSGMGGVPSFTNPTGLTDKTLAVPITANTFTLGYVRDASILGFVLLNATGQEQSINVLSTPHILTIDNQEAEINVGEEIAITTNTRVTESDSIYYTYEYKPVGLKLKITPHITNGERITMDFFLEANSVLDQTSTATTKPPDLGKRDMKTKISVHDGMTVVVGGLIRSSKKETEYKVPILGDIPLLGWFFKNKSKEDEKTNLLVFITPRVVTDPEKIKKITEEKEQAIKKMQEEKKN